MSYLSLSLGLAGGVVLLLSGAELLVRGASRLAASLGISPIVIGLTVVAFGTSAPELAVSLFSARRGISGIAVGNVVGSNIANVLLILGLSASIRPLAVVSRLVWRDVPLMTFVSVGAMGLAWNGNLSRWDGAILSVGLLLFLSTMRGSEVSGENETESVPQRANVWISLLSVGAGLGLLVVGSRLLVMSATEIARHVGLSELVIGLTLVALGTSLPELATSMVAAWRGERDIAVGNVVGSNLFNLLGVLGLSALFARSPLTVPTESLHLDFPVMIGSAVLCIVFFHSGRLISRSEGAFFLAAYVVYVAYLVAAGISVVPRGAVVTGLALIAAGLAFVLWTNRTTPRH